jgi:hypothetical protein
MAATPSPPALPAIGKYEPSVDAQTGAHKRIKAISIVFTNRAAMRPRYNGTVLTARPVDRLLSPD